MNRRPEPIVSIPVRIHRGALALLLLVGFALAAPVRPHAQDTTADEDRPRRPAAKRQNRAVRQ